MWNKLPKITSGKNKQLYPTKSNKIMKRFLFSFCFVAFLSGGLVSCADEAAEVTPVSQDESLDFGPNETEDKGGTTDGTRPI